MATGVASGGQDQPIRVHLVPIPEGERESPPGSSLRALERGAPRHAHAGGLSRLAQTSHHREGRLAAGKQSAVSLLHQLQPMGVKPPQGVAGTKA